MTSNRETEKAKEHKKAERRFNDKTCDELPTNGEECEFLRAGSNKQIEKFSVCAKDLEIWSK